MTRTQRFEVVLIESEEGFAVGCPILPGCWTQGDTKDEALENIVDAIGEYLAVQSLNAPDGEHAEVEVEVAR